MFFGVNSFDYDISVVDDKYYICIKDMAKVRSDNARAEDVIKIGIELDQRYDIQILKIGYVTQILKWSNLTTLKHKRDYLLLC